MDAEHISAFGSWAAAIGSSSAIVAYILERRERKSAQHELKQQWEESIESEVRRVVLLDNRGVFDPLALADKSNYEAQATNRSNDSVFNLHFIFETDDSTLLYTNGIEELTVGEIFSMNSAAEYGNLFRTWVTFEDIKGKHWWRSSTGTVSSTVPISLRPFYHQRESDLGIAYGSGANKDTPGLFTQGLTDSNY